MAQKIDGVRVNLIGYSAKIPDEAGLALMQKDFLKSYSVDKAGKIYRTEFYEAAQKINLSE
ncbi:M99 family metallo-carboxypeptidase C-terminal domain-containing protein [Campylobacter curvus]|uniref:M99 family metallo-carboxypeptidase C-terminal domain-containing protein n=1 Tax=Campylobacter curvus TaxID=200 RepID=UPI00146FC957|nr:M99 family metallo-carboxypeptidase C-terminal domain-containing protein [Campylobacter curvus]